MAWMYINLNEKTLDLYIDTEINKYLPIKCQDQKDC